MRKNLPLLLLGLVVAMVVTAFIGYTSYKKEQAPPAARDVKVSPAKITGDDSSSGKQSDNGEEKKEISGDVKDAKIPQVNPKLGEVMVWGEIKAIDVDKRILTIDQQLDDNSIKVSPNVPVDKDAVIRNKDNEISLPQILPGDTVGMIVTKNGQARAVLVNY